MLAEKHIRAYNALDGKPASKEKLQRLHAAIRKDIEAKRIDIYSPLGIDLFGIELRLKEAIDSINGPFDVEVITIKRVDIDSYLKLRSMETKKDRPKVIVKKIVEVRKVAAPRPEIKKPMNRVKVIEPTSISDPVKDKVADPTMPKVDTIAPLAKKNEKAKRVVVVGDSSIHGFFTADKAPEKPKNIFIFHGEIGKLLGEQQRYRLEIIIDGEKASSKSEFAKQLADAFIDIDLKVALIDYEMGGLESKDTQAGIDRNLKPGNKKKLFVSPSDFPATLDAIKGIADKFDVIIIDSGSKLNQVTNLWLDELRTEYPNTIWVVLMQQNAKGGTRGGAAAGYNAPVVIKTYRPDPTNQMKNYAWVEKNRGNLTDKWYLIAQKRTVTRDPGLGEIEEPKAPEHQHQAA